jgi:hypothetical protein
MTRQVIDAKNPPIVWSTVEEAFDKINQNFVNLYATINDGSGSVVDFEDLSTNVSPSSSGVFDLGSLTKRWRDLYLTGSSIDLGGAVITSPDGSVINLPSGSTVGGELIRNPQESSFKTIRVSGQSDVVADDFVGVLNFAGSGITISNNASTDTVTFANAGVTSLNVSTGLSLNQSTGAVTITNVGVTQAIAGSGINLNQSTGSIVISNTGVLELEQGSGVILTDLSGGRFRITNGAPNVAQNVFHTISVAGQPNVIADSTLDVLTILSGPGINITTNPTTDTITFAIDNRLDILGSVFAADSSVIVDSTNSTVYARLEGDVIGSVFSDNSTLLVDGTGGKIVGDVDSNIVQAQTSVQSQLYTNKSGQSLLLITGQAGTATVGIEGSEETGATAGGLAYLAGGTNSTDTAAGGDVQIFGGTGLGGGEVTVNGGNGKNGGAGGNTTLAGGANTDGTAQGGDIFIRGGRDLIGGVSHGRVYIGDQFTSEVLLTNPRIVGILDGDVSGSVFADDSTPIVDAIDKKVFATVEGNIFTNLIDSSDSSQIDVIPTVRFNSDVVVDNDLLVNNIPGYINIADLKAIVASAGTYSDFQNAIASL